MNMPLNKKLKILFDNQIFNLQKFGGISLYFSILIDSLSRDNEFECKLPLFYSDNENIKNIKFLNSNNSKKLLFKYTNKYKYGKKFISKINDLLNKNYLNSYKYSIFHPTYYDEYFLRYIGSKPFAITVYDMINEIFPEFYSPSDKTIYLKKNLIKKASKIITISKNTKKDIVNYYGIEEKKVEVIYLGNPFEILNIDEPKKQISFPKNYILYVGNRSFYKNFYFFVKAIRKILKKNDIYLICAGSYPFTLSEKSYFETLQVGNNIKHVNLSDYSILKKLYENAVCLVFPSIYEGFGLPILEAFYSGCPVALSNISVFKEVAQDAAVYFDAKDEVSICNVVNELLQDSFLREKIKKRGYEILKSFKWEDTINKTKNLYRSIV